MVVGDPNSQPTTDQQPRQPQQSRQDANSTTANDTNSKEPQTTTKPARGWRRVDEPAPPQDQTADDENDSQQTQRPRRRPKP